MTKFTRLRRLFSRKRNIFDRPVTFRDLHQIAYDAATFDGDTPRDPMLDTFLNAVSCAAQGVPLKGRRRDWNGVRRAITWDEFRRIMSYVGKHGGDKPTTAARISNCIQDGAFEVLVGRDEK